MLTQLPVVRDLALSPSRLVQLGDRRLIQNSRKLFCISRNKHELNKYYIDEFKVNSNGNAKWESLYETEENVTLPLLFGGDNDYSYSNFLKAHSTVVNDDNNKDNNNCTLYVLHENENGSFMASISIQNDIVTDICNLTNSFHDIMEEINVDLASNTLNHYSNDMSHIILNMIDYKSQCFIFLQGLASKQWCINLVSHDPNTKEFQMLNSWDTSRLVIAHQSIISNGNALYKVECELVKGEVECEGTIKRFYYENTINKFYYGNNQEMKWINLSRGIRGSTKCNVKAVSVPSQTKLNDNKLVKATTKSIIHDVSPPINDFSYLMFDCSVILKGERYCLFFEMDRIYLLDFKKSRIFHIESSETDCIDGVGEYYAILNANNDLFTVQAFIHESTKQGVISESIVPPNYLQKLISYFYCYEIIYLIRKTITMEIDAIWMIKIDQLLNDYLYK